MSRRGSAVLFSEAGQLASALRPLGRLRDEAVATLGEAPQLLADPRRRSLGARGGPVRAHPPPRSARPRRSQRRPQRDQRLRRPPAHRRGLRRTPARPTPARPRPRRPRPAPVRPARGERHARAARCGAPGRRRARRSADRSPRGRWSPARMPARSSAHPLALPRGCPWRVPLLREPLRHHARAPDICLANSPSACSDVRRAVSAVEGLFRRCAGRLQLRDLLGRGELECVALLADRLRVTLRVRGAAPRERPCRAVHAEAEQVAQNVAPLALFAAEERVERTLREQHRARERRVIEAEDRGDLLRHRRRAISEWDPAAVLVELFEPRAGRRRATSRDAVVPAARRELEVHPHRRLAVCLQLRRRTADARHLPVERPRDRVEE